MNIKENHKNFLYVDIGNTFIKFGIFKSEKNLNEFNIKTNRNELIENIFNVIKANSSNLLFSKIIISSVVTELDNTFIELNNKYFKAQLIFLNTHQKLPIKINEKVKDTIGADILATAIYVAANYKKAIVISFGTATVLSYIKNNELLGNIIAPGLFNSFSNLICRASKLAEVELTFPQDVIANNTKEALNIGFIRGFYHMIKGFINDIDPTAKILITGGDVNYLSQYQLGEVIYNMVIKGLKIYYG